VTSSDHLRELLAHCLHAGRPPDRLPGRLFENDQILNKDIKELSKAL
jgi:acetolactate synthase I/II/III large subunit